MFLINPTMASVASRPSAIVGLMRNSLSEATSGRALQPLWDNDPHSFNFFNYQKLGII